MFQGFTLSLTTMSRSLFGLYLTSAPTTFLWIQTDAPDMPWVGRPEYTIVCPSSDVKCPCPSLLTSDNPHISTPNLISSPTSWTFPNCSTLRIFLWWRGLLPYVSFSCFCYWYCYNGTTEYKFAFIIQQWEYGDCHYRHIPLLQDARLTGLNRSSVPHSVTEMWKSQHNHWQQFTTQNTVHKFNAIESNFHCCAVSVI